MDPNPISTRAERCSLLLGKIGERVDTGTELSAWLESVQIRSNLFTAKLGVFAAGSLSIDHRLRRNKTIGRAIVQILDSELFNLACCI